jgi:hypothetical protein
MTFPSTAFQSPPISLMSAPTAFQSASRFITSASTALQSLPMGHAIPANVRRVDFTFSPSGNDVNFGRGDR